MRPALPTSAASLACRPWLSATSSSGVTTASRRRRRYSAGEASAGRTEMTRPRRPVVKSTRPGRAAKMVSSLPMPTPSPGLNLVPRWRTMISPPFTTCPANTFTPSRWAFESRPLRLEPSPFLWAILGLLLLRGGGLLWRGLLRRRPRGLLRGRLGRLLRGRLGGLLRGRLAREQLDLADL